MERDLADSLAEASDEDGRGGRRTVDYGDFIEAIKVRLACLEVLSLATLP